jgi:hypothetical protein
METAIKCSIRVYSYENGMAFLNGDRSQWRLLREIAVEMEKALIKGRFDDYEHADDFDNQCT